jgi:hypothetical protein
VAAPAALWESYPIGTTGYGMTYCDESDNRIAQVDLAIEPHDGWVDSMWRSDGEWCLAA